MADDLVDKGTLIGDVGCTELAVFRYFVHREYWMVGIDKAVTVLQVKNLVYLTGKDQSVATHDRLIINSVGKHFVEMDDFYQMAAAYIVQPSLGYGLSDIWIVGRHQ